MIIDKSRKTNTKNDFLNLQDYLLVGAKSITRLLYYTPVTPHQVIFLSFILGVLSSYLIVQNERTLVFIGALCLYYKNVLDKVDGSLARAKNMTSRRGRFYDSLSDFGVSFAVFAAIGFKLLRNYPGHIILIICFFALVSSMFQCSFFVYYQVALIRFTGRKIVNRLIETVTTEDIENQDKLTTLLQRIFMLIYGWQDILVSRIDGYFRSKLSNLAAGKINVKDPVNEFIKAWYSNRVFLSIISILSIGTHMVLIALFAVLGNFGYYLFINIIVLNLLLITAVYYHYYSSKKLLNL